MYFKLNVKRNVNTASRRSCKSLLKDQQFINKRKKNLAIEREHLAIICTAKYNIPPFIRHRRDPGSHLSLHRADSLSLSSNYIARWSIYCVSWIRSRTTGRFVRFTVSFVVSAANRYLALRTDNWPASHLASMLTCTSNDSSLTWDHG